MRIGVYGSNRNCAHELEHWFKDTAEADVVVLNDTGSTDNSVDIARKFAPPHARVTQVIPEPMTAASIFNTALALLSDDVDLAMRLDTDEHLTPGWRAKIEQAWERPYAADMPVVLRPRFEHGRGGCEYRHTRVHSRRGLHWEYPVHEVLVPDVPGLVRVSDVDFTILHLPDPTKDRSQVLGELQAAHAAGPDDLHLWHYLGRELMYQRQYGDAIQMLRRHAHSDAFPEERSESWRYIGDCYTDTMPVDEVPVGPYRLAIQACPWRREGYVALADLCHKQGLWRECLDNALAALTITEKSWYFNWPFAWGSLPHDLAALACWFLGDEAAAIEHGEDAVAVDPTDERLRANMDWYTRRVA